MDISGLTSSAYSTASQTSASALEETLSTTNYSTATEEELMEACKSFESYFVKQLFEAMEKMVPKSDEDTDSSMAQTLDYFEDTLLEQYADAATERGSFGIAEKLYEQMKRNYNIQTVSEDEE